MKLSECRKISTVISGTIPSHKCHFYKSHTHTHTLRFLLIILIFSLLSISIQPANKQRKFQIQKKIISFPLREMIFCLLLCSVYLSVFDIQTLKERIGERAANWWWCSYVFFVHQTFSFNSYKSSSVYNYILK